MTERIQYPPVYLGLYFLLMTAVAAGMCATAPPLQATLYTLFWGAVYGAGIYFCRRAGEENEEQFQQLANGAAILALVLFFGGLTASSVETGLILLLLTLQAGRNLVLATRRDLNFACLISLVMLLYAAGKAMQGFFVIFLILYTLAGMFTFMADHIDARLSHAHGGDRDLLTRRMNLPVKGIGLALLTLAVAFGIYLLVPRPPSPRVQAFPSSSNWNYDNRHWEQEALTPRQDGQGKNGAGESDFSRGRERTPAEQGQMVNASEYGGFGNKFDVAEVGESVLRPDALLLHLQADNPLYVRGKVFDSFDGRSWEDSGYGAEKRYDREGRFALDGQPKPGDTLQLFTVRQDLPPFIFAAYRPILVSFPGNVIETDGAHALRAPDRLRKGTVYSVASRLEEVDRHPCSGALTADDDGRTADRRYLALYPGVSQRLRDLALEVTKGAGNDLQRAKAVEEYLHGSGNFAYTRATVGVQWSGNPVEQFLFELKAGHCELFASSMVTMLRTLDIPARLVTGFYANRYNPVTGYFEIRYSDGHAWVEAYLPPHGWVTFEPTSGFQLPTCSERLFVATGLVRYLGDRIEHLIYENRDSLWVKLLKTIWPILLKLWVEVVDVAVRLMVLALILMQWFTSGGWLNIVSLLAAVLAGRYLWRLLEPAWRLARLRRTRRGDPQRFLVLCYREMERHFARRGTARAPHLTPLEYRNLLTARFLPLDQQITLITRLFQQATYGPVPVAIAEIETEQALRAFAEIQRWKGSASARTTPSPSRPPR
ncbi:MAG: hypothetical protein A2075_09510 [Geobacteraceae bacterium GWC2_58_44]|nr:MAG: hypothetical protein A2075_09510 [Geobacteraceae bacterium GWC2_58_44]HBG08382.1 hypothetical protein [Geobacter sp.]